ncbi:MAG TPA: pyridoxamine 5'-phosphate oxidase family protein [Candidatus Polarisedimenticolia bacterium]|nr:pyridoxamine 5'-phosphate oxidase family protein [Candidatus Polarisedimenticolia bacterium]
MSSIHRNQPEDSLRPLGAQAAVEKIREIVDKAQSCFFCTSGASGTSSGVRPMNVRQVDDEGNLWFLSASDSHKNHELGDDPSVTLFFQGSPHSDFLHLHGTASVSRDRAKIEDLWEPVIRTWFTEGKDDPRITVIKVAPSHGYYWDTKHGTAVAGVKMLIGAVVRKTLDDSVEGPVQV